MNVTSGVFFFAVLFEKFESSLICTFSTCSYFWILTTMPVLNNICKLTLTKKTTSETKSQTSPFPCTLPSVSWTFVRMIFFGWKCSKVLIGSDKAWCPLKTNVVTTYTKPLYVNVKDVVAPAVMYYAYNFSQLLLHLQGSCDHIKTKMNHFSNYRLFTNAWVVVYGSESDKKNVWRTLIFLPHNVCEAIRNVTNACIRAANFYYHPLKTSVGGNNVDCKFDGSKSKLFNAHKPHCYLFSWRSILRCFFHQTRQAAESSLLQRNTW